MPLRLFDPSVDLPVVAELWNECMPPPFHVDLRLLEQNTVRCPHFRADGAFIFEQRGRVVGYVGCKVAQQPLGSLGMLPDRGWISVLFVHPQARRQGVADQLLRRAVAWLGPRQVLLGGDPAHFFPGVPENADDAIHFFTRQGFRFGEGRCWDLQQDIETWRPPPGLEETEARAGVTIGSCQVDWLAALHRFFERTFPGRWHHDVALRLAVEGDPRDVVVARGSDGVIHGFSSTYHPRSRVLGSSTYWREALGNHYGGLGPIGVSEDVRGKGLGLALVHRSIQYVQSRGTRSMAVDWTVLLDFYRKAGFSPWLSYRLSTGLER